MAIHDWNNDGKKDIMDDLIEYKIYEESVKGNNKNYTNKIKKEKTNNGEISSFAYMVSIVLGLIFTAVQFTLLDANIDNIPVLVICLIWLINTSIIVFIATIIKG